MDTRAYIPNSRQRHDEIQRRIAAEEIEATIKKLVEGSGVHISKLIWNLDQGFSHTPHHRLDIHTDHGIARTYFLDRQLMAYGSRQKDFNMEVRLHRLIDELRDGTRMSSGSNYFS